jgi:hypothetical protein
MRSDMVKFTGKSEEVGEKPAPGGPREATRDTAQANPVDADVGKALWNIGNQLERIAEGMQPQPDPGTSRVTINDHFINITVSQNRDYAAGLDQIDTPMKLLRWVHHVNQNFYDKALTNELIEKVCGYFGWDLLAD